MPVPLGRTARSHDALAIRLHASARCIAGIVVRCILVERAWHLLKSGLDIPPVFHYAPHRVCSHVSLTMLALLLVRIIENACKDSWRNIQNDLRRIKLAQLSTPQGEVWQVTEGSEDSRKRLKQLGIPPPSPVHDVVLRPTHTPSRA